MYAPTPRHIADARRVIANPDAIAPDERTAILRTAWDILNARRTAPCHIPQPGDAA